MSLENRVRAIEQTLYQSLIETQNAIATDHKLRQRVENQPEGMTGMRIGLCVSTIDPLKRGGIRMYHPMLSNRTTPVDALPWAYPVSTFGGFDDSGSIWVPPAGSKVVWFMHNNDRNSIYYFGTIWDRHRGSDQSSTSGSNSSGGHMAYWDNYANMSEYNCLWEGRRNGYNFGPNDGDEVLPPWNTEMYMGYDLDSLTTFYSDPTNFNSITYPYIYGFKTPEKHSLKLVDGDHKCNKRWKRLELRSSCNNVMLFKDDHLHVAQQWAFGSSPVAYCQGSVSPSPTSTGGSTTSGSSTGGGGSITLGPIVPGIISSDQSQTVKEIPCCDDDDTPVEECEDADCIGESGTTCINVPRQTNSTVNRLIEFADPFYKRSEEQVFYEGVNTPMQNRCNLPQSGIQLQSISGQQMIFDDSVDQPTGVPTWNREFDFGCNNLYKGRISFLSATGHMITVDDQEDIPNIRNQNNGIFFETACGTTISMSDDTEQEGDACECPENYGGTWRGITAQTTSNHLFQMIDTGVRQCASPRVNGGIPQLEDTHRYEGYIMLRSGYGLQLMMKDKDIQTETNQQFIEMLAPQKNNTLRGPHIMMMQEAPQGPGFVMLRAGGVFYQQSVDDSIEVVGYEGVPVDANKWVSVKNNYLVDVKEYYYNHNELTFFQAEQYIFLLAGRDCPEPPLSSAEAEGTAAAIQSNQQVNDTAAGETRTVDKGPCIYPVICAQDPWRCPVTGFVHFGFMGGADGTEFDSRSERVFISGRKHAGDSPAGATNSTIPSTSSFSTAGGNPPSGADAAAVGQSTQQNIGGPPAELPDNIGQDGGFKRPIIPDNQAAEIGLA